jgi:hypothetical protein
MQFDVVLTNPPFQDRVQRGKTPHKLWLEFTQASLSRWLVQDGLLVQVSPASFRSPSNRVLELMKAHRTEWIDLDVGHHFPDVASTFATYAIRRSDALGEATVVHQGDTDCELVFDQHLFYLPSVLSPEAIAVHRKVVFESEPKLAVEKDYVTCHNILLRRSDSLSKVPTDRHVHPVFHTNRQTWWSSILQDFAEVPKVMWTRSGYTKPFYDPGTVGGTDMVYFVRVESDDDGRALAHNLNRTLMRYIFMTGKWSGFGNERVFHALPDLPRDRCMTDEEMFDWFALTEEEVAHVRSVVG